MGSDARILPLGGHSTSLEVGKGITPDKVDCTLNIARLVVMISVGLSSQKSVLPSNKRASIEADMGTIDGSSQGDKAGLSTV